MIKTENQTGREAHDLQRKDMGRGITAILAFFLFFMMIHGLAQAADNSLAEITGLRANTDGERTRVVIDATGEVDYRTMALSAPGRVVVDLMGARLSPKVQRELTLSGDFASRVRIAQNNKETVRVVIETDLAQNPKAYDVFSLRGGSAAYRVVMDIGGKGITPVTPVKPVTPSKPTTPSSNKQEDTHSPNVSPSKPTNPFNPNSTNHDTSKGKGTRVIDFSGGNKDTNPTNNNTNNSHNSTSDTTDSSKKNQTNVQPENKNDQQKNNQKPSARDEDTDDNKEHESTRVLQGRSITIDPGHGGSDTGAIGPTGVTEKSVTLRIAKRLEELLEDAGAKVYMTRKTDTEVSPKGAYASDVEELQARCDVANRANTDIFVSIHMDSFSNGGAHGTTGYYYTYGSDASQRLARLIKNRVVSALGTMDRGAKAANFYVIRKTTMPAVLIEVAFVSNPDEELLLNSSVGIERAAQAIYQGIVDYFAK